jgi:DNA-binding LacI/PurR family transcriptional regulator
MAHNQPMSTKSRRRPKIADVARLAEVSEAAVSVVLNGRVGESARVSEETQARIWDAVRKLGYAANPVARSLAGGHNRIIGVFTFEPTFPIESRDFYYPFLVGVESAAAAQDYDLLLFASAGTNGKRSIYRNGINRLQLADGAILLGRSPDRAELQRLAADGYPFVFIGRRESPGYVIPYAAAGYADATAQIVQYMLEHGHRRIVYFRTPEVVESATDREQGFRMAFQNAGMSIEAAFIWRGSQSEITPAVLKKYIQLGATAFLAEDDAFGEALLAQTAALNLVCPTDFSLAVLGDSLAPTALPRDWTSFKIPREAMGREAVRLLLKMLTTEGDSLESYQITLPCTFVPGSTVAIRKDF